MHIWLIPKFMEPQFKNAHSLQNYILHKECSISSLFGNLMLGLPPTLLFPGPSTTEMLVLVFILFKSRALAPP